VTDFQGTFSPGNWTETITNGGDGFVTLNGPLTSVSFTGGNNGVDSDVDFTIAAPSAGTVAFTWSYSTTDSGDVNGDAYYDPFFFLSDGLLFSFQLTTEFGANQGGSESFSVGSGDVFGFRQSTLDGLFGSATTIVSNFTFTPGGVSGIPEPSGAMALGLIFGLSVFGRRRR
jgi:hypothetical protein